MTQNPSGGGWTAGVTAAVFSLNGGTVMFNNGGNGINYGNSGGSNNSDFANSVVNLAGGTLNMNNASIGSQGSGLPINQFNMSGGVLQNASNLDITAGTSNFTQTGGTVLVDTTSQAGTNMTTSISNLYTIAGGSILQLNAGTTGSGVVKLTTPTLARSSTGSYQPDANSRGRWPGDRHACRHARHYSGPGLFRRRRQFTRNFFNISNGSGGRSLAGNGTFTNLLQPWVIARAHGAGNSTADFTQFDNGTSNVQSFAGNYNTYAATSGFQATATVNDVGIITAPQTVTNTTTVYALKVQSTISGSGTLNIAGGVCRRQRPDPR